MSDMPVAWKAEDRAYSTHNHPSRFWETGISDSTGAFIGRSAGATEQEAKDNARLMAAAPELLIALECMVKELNRPTGMISMGYYIEMADDAIERARKV